MSGRLRQELCKIGLPEFGPSVGAMALGVRAGRDHDEARAGHFGNFTFGDAKFGWVDEIICGIDPEDRHCDLRKIGGWVVMA
jgi:hypothetical protein